MSQRDRSDDSDELRRTRVVRLDGPLTDDTVNAVVAKLLFLEFEDNRRPLTLHIDSPGGGVAAGMAIVDAIRFLSAPVHTHAPLQAHAMAAIVLAAGRKGERVIGPTAAVSVLPIEADGGGSVGDIERVRRRLTSLLAELTGSPEREVGEWLSHGRVFAPAEAIACGLADRIGG